MGVDYYKILKVDRNAKYDDLKKAYKEAEAQFKQISEAYGVLSDPQKRAVYDRYGEEGPQGHMPRSDAGGPGGGATYFSTGEGPTTFHSNPRSRDDVFQEFFGFTSPYDDPQSPHAGRQSSGSTCFSPGNEPTTFHSNPRRPDDIFQEFFGCSSPFGSSGGGSRKAPPIENSLPCSLEELYKGTTKKMKITRDIVHRSGKIMQVEEVLTIDVKRGWKKGTKITFPEKGNEKPNVMPADVVFIIDEKPHRVFTRDGNDLIVTKNISLAEAIAGYTVHLTTLDGRNLIIPIDTVIHPNYEEIAPREGMPLPKDPSKKGNLRIKFNIFPTRLTVEQKAGIKKLLGA